MRNGQFVANKNRVNYELVNYGVVNGQYRTQCIMNETIMSTGANVVSTTVGNVPEGALEELTKVAKTPFKQIFEEYCELRSRSNYYDLTLRTNRIEFEKPLVRQAFEVLGAERVRELKYHQGNIKRELAKVSHETLETKIFMIIKDQLPLGIAIPCTTIKKILQDAYSRLGSKQKPKATDLKQWYNIKKTTRRGDDGKMVACLAIISTKYKVPSKSY